MRKRKIFLIFIVVIITIIIIAFFSKVFITNSSEDVVSNIKNKFRISKIHYYSGVNAINNQTTYQNPEWNLNIYQYTDIAIYVERIEEYNNSNYIKEVYLDNFKISSNNLNNKKLFYLNPLDFGIAKNVLDTEINDELKYSVVNAENNENDMTYGIPIYFEDCSNPITIRYVNDKIVENYKFANSETLEFNGSLLQNANIKMDELSTTVSFDLNIVTSNDELHNISKTLKIPLEYKNSTIYEKSIEVVDKEDSKF